MKAQFGQKAPTEAKAKVARANGQGNRKVNGDPPGVAEIVVIW